MLSSTFATILFVFQCSMLIWLNPGKIIGTIVIIILIAHDWVLFCHTCNVSVSAIFGHGSSNQDLIN